MPLQQEIQTQLEHIRNWVGVSFKKNVLNSLNQVLCEDEELVDLLEGFYSGDHVVASGSGAPGILCITDRRLLFLLNGGTGNTADRIGYDEISGVGVRRTDQSVKITLHRGASSSVLTSTKRGGQADSFIESVRSRIGEDLVEIEDYRSAEQEEPGRQSPDKLSNLNFLHKEAQRIIRAINQYKQFNHRKR